MCRGPLQISHCRSSGTQTHSLNGVWLGHWYRMTVVLLHNYHPIDPLQPKSLAFVRSIVSERVLSLD